MHSDFTHPSFVHETILKIRPTIIHVIIITVFGCMEKNRSCMDVRLAAARGVGRERETYRHQISYDGHDMHYRGVARTRPDSEEVETEGKRKS